MIHLFLSLLFPSFTPQAKTLSIVLSRDGDSGKLGLFLINGINGIASSLCNVFFLGYVPYIF